MHVNKNLRTGGIAKKRKFVYSRKYLRSRNNEAKWQHRYIIKIHWRATSKTSSKSDTDRAKGQPFESRINLLEAFPPLSRVPPWLNCGRVCARRMHVSLNEEKPTNRVS